MSSLGSIGGANSSSLRFLQNVKFNGGGKSTSSLSSDVQSQLNEAIEKAVDSFESSDESSDSSGTSDLFSAIQSAAAGVLKANNIDPSQVQPPPPDGRGQNGGGPFSSLSSDVQKQIKEAVDMVKKDYSSGNQSSDFRDALKSAVDGVLKDNGIDPSQFQPKPQQAVGSQKGGGQGLFANLSSDVQDQIESAVTKAVDDFKSSGQSGDIRTAIKSAVDGVLKQNGIEPPQRRHGQANGNASSYSSSISSTSLLLQQLSSSSFDTSV